MSSFAKSVAERLSELYERELKAGIDIKALKAAGPTSDGIISSEDWNDVMEESKRLAEESEKILGLSRM